MTNEKKVTYNQWDSLGSFRNLFIDGNFEVNAIKISYFGYVTKKYL